MAIYILCFSWSIADHEKGHSSIELFVVQNAVSVAGLLMTTEAMVAEKPEEKKTPATPGMPPEDMY